MQTLFGRRCGTVLCLRGRHPARLGRPRCLKFNPPASLSTRGPFSPAHRGYRKGKGGMRKLRRIVMRRRDSTTRSRRPPGVSEEEYRDLDLEHVLAAHHSNAVADNECASVVVQRIEAPASVVWSMVRRFDRPQTYKRFVRSCSVKDLEVKVGSVREIKLISGLPAKSSTERLEILDNEARVFGFRVIGGEHRLHNYCSVTTLTEFVKDGRVYTMVIESYVSRIPQGNTREDTCIFIETVIRCNLQSLMHVAQQLSKTQDEGGFLPHSNPN